MVGVDVLPDQRHFAHAGCSQPRYLGDDLARTFFFYALARPKADALDPAVLAQIRAQYHLDRPLYAQYVYWLGGVLSGKLGESMRLKEPVLKLIAQKFPVTLQLALMAIAIALLIGLALISYDPHDASFNVSAAGEFSTWHNWIGPVGAYGADLFFQVFGFAAFLLPMALLAVGWLMRPSTVSPWIRRKLHLLHHKVSGTAADIEDLGHVRVVDARRDP